jgi:hypothetical protein
VERRKGKDRRSAAFAEATACQGGRTEKRGWRIEDSEWRESQQPIRVDCCLTSHPGGADGRAETVHGMPGSGL